MVGDGDKPDPEAFKVHMRTVHAGDDTGLRHDDFVGSYDHTGRVKLEKKKWTPKKPDTGDNAFRSDDWMGSGAKQRRSWQVKSTTNVGGKSAGDEHKPDEFLAASTSPTATRKWVPPPKDQAIPPPWMSSPTGSSTRSPRASWHPTSKPFHASDHTKDTSVQSDLSFSDLHIPSTHSHVKDAIERLSGSMTHMSLEATKTSDRAWKSHSALNHDPKSHDSHHDSSKGTAMSHEHDEGSHSAFEVDSEDEEFHQGKTASPAVPHVSSPGAVRSVIDSHDDDKPDPEQYKVHIRTSGEGSMMKHDDFVGSYNHTGRTKLEPKKWTPPSKTEPGDNVFKSDDWMGSGKTQRRSWQVKSPTKVGVPMNDRKSEVLVSPSNPVTHKWKPLSKDNVISSPWMSPTTPKDHGSTPSHHNDKPVVVSPKPTEPVNHEGSTSPPSPEKERSSFSSSPSKVDSAAPAIVPAVGYVVGDDDGRPDPEAFKIHMRTVHAGEDSAFRHDDFVGSYNHTGRTKLDKKWKPTSKPEVGDNAFRSDDWMGSGKTQKRTWQVKSPSHVSKPVHDEKPTEFVSPSHAATQKWNPSSTDHPASPPLHPTSAHAERDTAAASHHDEEKHHTVESEVTLSKPTETVSHEVPIETSSPKKQETSPAPSPKSESVAQTSSPVAAPTIVPAVGYVVGDDDGRPDPEAFKIHMRTVHAGEDSAFRHDDFVGSYSHTGRTKLDKKWKPTSKPETGDNAFRSDDWMGSGAPKKKSWKVKD